MIELGAYDGYTLSNSYAFSKLGWRTLLIEPSTVEYQRATRFRPADIVVNAAVCDTRTDPLLFVPNGPMGGLWDSMPDLIKDMHPGHEYLKPTKMYCVLLGELLTKFGAQHVDFLSLDVEGAEVSVLRTLNFTQTRIDVIALEEQLSEENRVEIHRRLVDEGPYRYTGDHLRSSWFVRRDFVPNRLIKEHAGRLGVTAEQFGCKQLPNSRAA